MFLAILLFIVIYPMVWMFLGSFKTQDEFLNEPFWALPNNWSLDNYVDVFTIGNFGQYIANSIIVVFPSLAVILILGVAAGFALEVMVWKGESTVLLLFLVGHHGPHADDPAAAVHPLLPASPDRGAVAAVLHLCRDRAPADGVHDGHVLPRGSA